MKTIYLLTESNEKEKMSEFINTYSSNSRLKKIMFPIKKNIPCRGLSENKMPRIK